MKRILTLFLSVALIASSAFARAGSSHSRSSSSHSSWGSSSSSHSYSRPTPSYTRPAPVQRTYAKPNPSRPVAAPVTRANDRTMSGPTATHTTVNKTTVIHKNYNNGGSNGYNNNRNNNNNDNGNFGGNNGGGGMGIMGTMAGVAGGVVVGNLLTSALTSDHRNAGYAPAGGYASTPAGVPLAGQPVAPAMAGAESGSYVTDGKGGVVQADQYQGSTTGAQSTPSSEPTGMSGSVSTVSPASLAPSEPHGFDWFAWYMWLVYIALGIGLIIATVALYRRWRVSRDRKLEVAQMLEEEHNLGVFKHIFTQVQSSYASGANVNLIHLLTPAMYSYIMLQKSETEDNGLTNIIEEVKVLSAVNVRSWESDGIQFQQVKLRFSMIDYTVDNDDVVHHGSKTTPETAVEYWTFQSSSKGVWVLASIDQHAGYVHQITD